MAGNVVVADQGTFDGIIGQPGIPVIVDFWAAWCVPCRMIAPVLDELATERGDQIMVVKVNVDENPVLAARYGIMSIPTVVRFQDGQEASRAVGALPKAQLLRKLGV
ncbi:MAG: thioredoxin [Thermaerobacter sp.]|nr:thioredoxin [Thermaerobacter sp.]